MSFYILEICARILTGAQIQASRCPALIQFLRNIVGVKQFLEEPWNSPSRFGIVKYCYSRTRGGVGPKALLLEVLATSGGADVVATENSTTVVDSH